MGVLVLTYTDSFDREVNVSQVRGEDLLDCLGKLHEELNAVGMPRKYRSSTDQVPVAYGHAVFETSAGLKSYAQIAEMPLEERERLFPSAKNITTISC